jgi:hypothetical protein
MSRLLLLAMLTTLILAIGPAGAAEELDEGSVDSEGV